MSDQIEDIVENLKQSSVWSRILLMMGFAFVLYMVVAPAIVILTIAQALFAAITGQPNRNLRGLGSLIQQYVSQIIDFVSYNSELRPFPFTEFPAEEIVEGAVKKKAKKASKPKADTKAVVKKAVKKKAPTKKPAAPTPTAPTKTDDDTDLQPKPDQGE
ncbi:MAG: hypothetical protein ACI95C_002602 [Pseudohongiellaceae bacterium]|jgi:hypothetical protein